MTGPVTLALDPGEFCGWYLGAAVGPVKYGTFKLEDTSSLQAYLHSFDPFLREMLPQADHLAVELPWFGDDFYVVEKLIGMYTHAAWWAKFEGIGPSHIFPVKVKSAKQALTGNGLASKDEMIAAAVAEGLEDPDQHTADAYGVWKYHVFGNRPKVGAKPRNGPVTVIKP